jgi:regulator of replication initiation timing
MNDPLTLGLASTAAALVNNTIGLLKEAREAAKHSDDHDLKDKLSEVYDSFLELKEAVGNLREENQELRKRLETRASLNWNAKQKLYFAEGDPDPFCPVCLDVKGTQIRLHPEYFNSGVLYRHECKVCKNYFLAISD